MDKTSSHRCVVTGAGRGLGLEFTRQLLVRGCRVVATCRQPGQANALNQLAGEFPGHLHVLPLEVDSEPSREAFATELQALHDGLELLVNNAGVLPSGETFGSIDPDVLAGTLATNTIAPLMLAQRLAPLLAKGERPRILNVGSALGSIARTQAFRTPSYNISKAGLNMAGVLMAHALNPQGIGVITASPGWVRTDMGGEGAELSPEESVRSLVALVDALPGVPAGVFVDRQGELLPW